jgi:hypothetical protein
MSALFKASRRLAAGGVERRVADSRAARRREPQLAATPIVRELTIFLDTLMVRVKVMVTADPQADIGPDARAALGFRPDFVSSGDKPGPAFIESPGLGSQSPIEQIEQDLDLGLPGWRARLSVVLADD